MACVVQIHFSNRKRKSLLILVLWPDECVDMILEKLKWAFFVCELSDLKLLIPASAKWTWERL